ncbi:MAG: hypothetical protein PVI79_10300 [Gammaproteobacteria bacterium]
MPGGLAKNEVFGPILLVLLILAGAAGCSSASLGQLDETRSERDDMRGPGIFADENGETVLKWSTDDEPAKSTASDTGSPAIDERAEFEQFKQWQKLRTEGKASAEYREFLQWLKFQEFKAAQ